MWGEAGAVVWVAVVVVCEDERASTYLRRRAVIHRRLGLHLSRQAELLLPLLH